MITWAFGASDDGNSQKVMEEAYTQYKRLMFATAGKFVTNAEDQEDIVQSALERLIKIFSSDDASKRCISAGYIVYTVRSVSIDFLRKKAQEGRHYIRIEDEDLAEMIQTSGTLEDLLLPSDSADRLWAIWPRLSPEDQLLLEGKYILERTDKELASILKCSPNSVRMKLTRARQRAIKLLAERKTT